MGMTVLRLIFPPLFENVFHFTTRFFGAHRFSEPISKWVCYADNSSSFFFFENKSTLYRDVRTIVLRTATQANPTGIEEKIMGGHVECSIRRMTIAFSYFL